MMAAPLRPQGERPPPRQLPWWADEPSPAQPPPPIHQWPPRTRAPAVLTHCGGVRAPGERQGRRHQLLEHELERRRRNVTRLERLRTELDLELAAATAEAAADVGQPPPWRGQPPLTVLARPDEHVRAVFVAGNGNGDGGEAPPLQTARERVRDRAAELRRLRAAASHQCHHRSTSRRPRPRGVSSGWNASSDAAPCYAQVPLDMLSDSVMAAKREERRSLAQVCARAEWPNICVGRASAVLVRGTACTVVTPKRAGGGEVEQPKPHVGCACVLCVVSLGTRTAAGAAAAGTAAAETVARAGGVAGVAAGGGAEVRGDALCAHPERRRGIRA
eukprot:COSAG01_NODE_9050_length_2569_cov_15.643320_3_plen_332_part_00